MTTAEFKAEMRVEREELCVEWGFANRFTAMIFQWVCDDFNRIEYPDLDEASEAIRDYVIHVKKVPAYRVRHVDFHQIALCLQG